MAKQQALLAGLLAVIILGAAAYWFTQQQPSEPVPAPTPVTTPKADAAPKAETAPESTEAPAVTDATAATDAPAKTTAQTSQEMQDEIDRLAEEIMHLDTVDPDKIALIEEVRDQLRAEHAELTSRLRDLKEQLQDSEQLIQLKSAQIADLEAKLEN